MDMQMGLAARANLYAAFFQVFGGKPTDELVEALDEGLLSQSAAVLAEGLGEDRAGVEITARESLDLEALQSGYMRLFEGPGAPKAQPWESLHESKQPRLFNEVTLAVRRFYKACDVRVAAGQGVADDHAALELAFLRELATRALAACPEEAQAAVDLEPRAATALAASAQFLDEHLMRWAPKLAACVAEAEPKLASGGFYTAWANALVAFLDLDRRWLAAVLPEIDPETGRPMEA